MLNFMLLVFYHTNKKKKSNWQIVHDVCVNDTQIVPEGTSMKDWKQETNNLLCH